MCKKTTDKSIKLIICFSRVIKSIFWHKSSIINNEKIINIKLVLYDLVLPPQGQNSGIQ